MKCIPFSNAFTIIMEIYYMCSTFCYIEPTIGAETNREKEREREICVRILFISSWNHPNYVWYLTCAIEQKPCTNHFVLMKCAHHFLLTLFEWYLPLGFWWSKIQFHFRKFIVVHCLVKVRAFSHRLNLCSNKILWMVGSLFQLFPLFRMLFCEQILWYTIKSHIPVFTCFLEIFLVRRKPTHHRTIQLLVLLPVHTPNNNIIKSVSSIYLPCTYTFFVRIFIANIRESKTKSVVSRCEMYDNMHVYPYVVL